MKLVLTLLVRDEEDIIYENILFHLNQGVDFIIATDNKSVDGTPEILREFEKQGVLKIIQEDDDTYAQSRWVTRMARMAISEFQADWVINCDADEFWWPLEGNLNESLENISSYFDIISVERHNFCPRENQTGPWHQSMVYRTKCSTNHLGKKLIPKICHRGFPDVMVAQGNHYLEFPHNLKTAPKKPIEIFHFPLRSAAQFKNKIACGGAAYSRNQELSQEVGDCWRKLYTDLQDGKLDTFMNNQIFSEDQLQSGLNDGSLILDTRLKNFLEIHL